MAEQRGETVEDRAGIVRAETRRGDLIANPEQRTDRTGLNRELTIDIKDGQQLARVELAASRCEAPIEFACPTPRRRRSLRTMGRRQKLAPPKTVQPEVVP